ncbi:MAG: HEAT repeat domain-containing protein [Nitrospira sp.]|nr:HEAT repeat domain-containing protein [Nitrospira sp.]
MEPSLSNMISKPSTMPHRAIFANLAALGALIALLGIVYWQHTGARAVPGLIEELQGTDAQAQQLAAAHLKEIGLAAKPAVPALLALALDQSHPYPGATAAAALTTIDLTVARQAMDRFVLSLGRSDLHIKRDAAAALGSLGPLAKPAVPALIRALDDPDPLVRDRVTRSLGQIGIPERAVSAALLRSLKDSDRLVRHTALSQLAFGGPIPPDLLPRLKELTQDQDRQIAQLASSTVAREQQPISASVLAMSLNVGTAKLYTLLQLARLGPRAVDTVASVTPLLAAELPLERYLAAAVLEAIGPAASEALPALRLALNDTDPVVRETAVQAVQALEQVLTP